MIGQFTGGSAWNFLTTYLFSTMLFFYFDALQSDKVIQMHGQVRNPFHQQNLEINEKEFVTKGLLQMEHHLEARRDTDLTERAVKVAEFVQAEFHHLCLDTDLILKIMAILDVNSFEIPSMDATVQVFWL